MTTLDTLLREMAELVTVPCPQPLGGDNINYLHPAICFCQGSGKLKPWVQPCPYVMEFTPGRGLTREAISQYQGQHDRGACPCQGIGFAVGIKEPDGTVRGVHEGDVLNALPTETQIIEFCYADFRKVWVITVYRRGASLLEGEGQTRLEAALQALKAALDARSG